MYPVPPKKNTQGLTEKYIGSWLNKTKRRKDVMIASKVTGPAPDFSYIRDPLQIDKENIEIAIEKNLKRLNTDYIDLYQIHWPQRQTNYFGELNYKYTKENIQGYQQMHPNSGDRTPAAFWSYELPGGLPKTPQDPYILQKQTKHSKVS